ncbi:MAG TPA: SusC/RagA family TonB-linked outer membrane protein, partial [Bacteroidetes bacterium]|nr:SusC/RagA family TonB-linked outer membrane protein [Bacteroidota bacterium]
MKKIYLFALICLMASMGYAQHQVSGSVLDAETGEPMSGASIVEKGTSNGSLVAIDGKYQISLKSGRATLIVKYIGYSTQEIQLAGETKLDIKLKVSAIQLEDNVMTALSVKRQAKALGYTVQRLNSKAINEIKGGNFVDNLAGKVAGVTVSQGATGIGSTSKITIRGEASFTNNNPLFVVDGTPINNNSVVNFTNDAAAGFQEVDFGNGAMEINPDDIASVSILKGPGAAALYGTRASNGVIIITTKDGANQKGIGVRFNSSTFAEQAFQLPHFQNKFGQGNSGQFEFVDGLGGGINDNITYSWGPALDQGLEIAQYDSPVTLPDGSVVRGGDVAVHGGAPISPSAFDSHPDNLKNFYQTGLSTINNISLSSGFDRGNFRLSYTDFRSKSIIPGVNLDRQTVAGRFGFQPIDRLKVSSSINYIHSSSDNRPSGGYGSENINYSLVAWGPRSLNTETLRDYWQPGLENVQQYSFNYTFFDNPFFILKENRN